MFRPLLFLLPFAAWAATPRVAIRDSEVWVTRDGQGKQLTNDGRAKLQAVLSPSEDRVAYYEQCPQAEHCRPSVVILDLDGHRISSFQPLHQAVPPAEPCGSILSIAWAGDNAIGAECHINPSLSEYIETDLSTGATIRDLLGYDFTRSPDGTKVAHVGWIVHFAPPYAQSNYLQVDHTTVYPLPPGIGPVEQKVLEQPPDVVQRHGPTYSGIHEFVPGLAWSPDSGRIALVDCTYDWTPNHPAALNAGDGKESNRRCSVVVVSTKGVPAVIPLRDVSVVALRQSRLAWLDLHRISLRTGSLTRVMAVP